MPIAFMSIHSCHFIHFSSFMSSHSCQVIDFKLFISFSFNFIFISFSLHFIFIAFFFQFHFIFISFPSHFISFHFIFISFVHSFIHPCIHSFISIPFISVPFISILSFHFPLILFLHVDSFISQFLHCFFVSTDSFQFIHYYMYFISFQFTSFQFTKPCHFFETSALARAGHSPTIRYLRICF